MAPKANGKAKAKAESAKAKVGSPKKPKAKAKDNVGGSPAKAELGGCLEPKGEKHVIVRGEANSNGVVDSTSNQVEVDKNIAHENSEKSPTIDSGVQAATDQSERSETMPCDALSKKAHEKLNTNESSDQQLPEEGTSGKFSSSADWKAMADCKRSLGVTKYETPCKRVCVEWSLPSGAPVFHGCPHASLRDPFFEECALVEGKMLTQKYQCKEGCEQCESGWKHIWPSYWRPMPHSSSCSSVGTLSSHYYCGDEKDKMRSLRHVETQPSKRKMYWHSLLPSFLSRRLFSSSHSSTVLSPSQSCHEDGSAEAKTSKQDPEVRPNKRRRIFGNWFSQ